MYYLGIDIGSTFIKGAILDDDALSLSHIERVAFPEPVAGLNPRFREYSPEEVVTAVSSLVERLLARAPDAAGLLVCSQLHGMVLCDADGRALSNLINWQDQRALLPPPGSEYSCYDEIERIISKEERRQLGNERVPGLPLNYLFWFARNRTLPAAPVVPAALAYFVAARLCGGVPVSDVTHAYGHGALHIGTLDWHRPVIDKLGLGGVQWPRIVPQGAVIGEWRTAGRALPVYAPVGDYHCSQVGALLEEGELSVNISTGSAVILISEQCETGDFQTRPWFDGRFLKTVTHIPGGRALNKLLRLLGELAAGQGIALSDPWDYILGEAGRVDSGGLQVNPAFYFSSMGCRGSIQGLCEENMTLGHLFHAMFEGMAGNYAQCAARISPERDWHRLVFSGGVALKAPLLRRLICERLGQEHRLAPSDEDALFGLLVLSLAFSGRTGSVSEAIALARNNHHPPQNEYGSILTA